MFISPDAAWLVLTSFHSCTCLFPEIQKIQETTSCLSPSNGELSVLYDNARQGVSVWNNQQEKRRKKDTHRRIDMLPLQCPPTELLCPCGCHRPTKSPHSPLSSRPLLSLHSFFQNLSRVFNPACVWADVQKTSLQQPGWGGGNSSNSAQTLFPHPATRLHSPPFFLLLLLF